MGRRFTGGATNDLILEDDLGISTYPFSMFCWFKAADITNVHHLIFLGDKDFATDYVGITASGNVASDPVRAVSHSHNQDGAGAAVAAESSAGYVADQWHSALAVFVSDAERHVWLDGSNKDTDTTAISGSLAASDYDRFSVGAFRDTTPGYPTDVIIDWICVWNLELDDTDASDLHNTMVLPNTIQPTGVLGFWQLTGINPELDQSGNNYHLNLEGTLALAGNPPLMPSRSDVITAAEANFNASGTRIYYQRVGFGGSSKPSGIVAGYRGPEIISNPPAAQVNHAGSINKATARVFSVQTATTVTSGQIYSFITPPEMPGVWNYAVEPADDKPETGNKAPSRTAVSHDLISYWLHPDISDPNNDCMTLTYNDTTFVLNVTMRPSRDFLRSGNCASDSVSVAESVTVSIA